MIHTFYRLTRFFQSNERPVQRFQNSKELITLLTAIGWGEHFYIQKTNAGQNCVLLRNVKWWKRLWIRVSFQCPRKSQQVQFLSRLIQNNSSLITSKKFKDTEIRTHYSSLSKYRDLKKLTNRFKGFTDISDAMKPLTTYYQQKIAHRIDKAQSLLKNGPYEIVSQNVLLKEKENQNRFALNEIEEQIQKAVNEAKEKTKVCTQVIVPIPTHNGMGAKYSADVSQHDIEIQTRDGKITAPRFILSECEWFNNTSRKKFKDSPSIVHIDYPHSVVKASLNLLYGIEDKVNSNLYPEMLSFASFICNEDLIKLVEEKIILTQLNKVDEALFWSNEQSLYEQGLPITPLIQRHAAEILAKHETINNLERDGLNLTPLCLIHLIASPHFNYESNKKPRSDDKSELELLTIVLRLCYKKAEMCLLRKKEQENLLIKKGLINSAFDFAKGLIVSSSPSEEEIQKETLKIFHTKFYSEYPRNLAEAIRWDQIYVNQHISYQDVPKHKIEKFSLIHLVPLEDRLELDEYLQKLRTFEDLSCVKKYPYKSGFKRVEGNNTSSISYDLWVNTDDINGMRYDQQCRDRHNSQPITFSVNGRKYTITLKLSSAYVGGFYNGPKLVYGFDALYVKVDSNDSNLPKFNVLARGLLQDKRFINYKSISRMGEPQDRIAILSKNDLHTSPRNNMCGIRIDIQVGDDPRSRVEILD
jgi:hypothetical protein